MLELSRQLRQSQDCSIGMPFELPEKYPWASAAGEYLPCAIAHLRFLHFCGGVKDEDILFQKENQDHAESPKDLYPGV